MQNLVFELNVFLFFMTYIFLVDIQFGFWTYNFQKAIEEDGKLLPEFEDADESEWLLYSYSICLSFLVGKMVMD